MWKSACCLFITLLLAIIGLAFDILMVQTGTTFFGEVGITLYYGWQDMSWTIDAADYNYTSSIRYSEAYSEYCNGTLTTTTMCKDLKDVRDAGRLYLGFNIVGIVLITTALTITIFALLGKCLCSCRCHTGWVVSILAICSVVCFLIAFCVFLSDFSESTNELVNEMTPYKLIDWGSAYIGPSIGCLITAACLGLTSLSCILWLDRGYWRRNQNYEILSAPYVAAPPPMVVYNPYGMPPPGPPPPGTYYQQPPNNNNITPV